MNLLDKLFVWLDGKIKAAASKKSSPSISAEEAVEEFLAMRAAQGHRQERELWQIIEELEKPKRRTGKRKLSGSAKPKSGA